MKRKEENMAAHHKRRNFKARVFEDDKILPKGSSPFIDGRETEPPSIQIVNP